MLHFAEGGGGVSLDAAVQHDLLARMIACFGPLRRVLLVPPDFTRLHSGAGEIATHLYHSLTRQDVQVELMPALGTHVPLNDGERRTMFPGVPADRFLTHDWRRDVVRLGEIPAETVRDVSGGRVDFALPCEVNRRLIEGSWDRIISIGQVVPHEVTGMANHAKNIFIGLGGAETIGKSHYLGAVCGMERAMGRADAPARLLLDRMAETFGRDLPITYVLTVRERDAETGTLSTCGLFAGDDRECFERAADLSLLVNVTLLEKPLRRAAVYLDPAEYKSFWLGAKAIYRLRMAMADGGELLVVGPGLERFGEDATLDALIRRTGYRGTEAVVAAVKNDADLRGNLGAAAHLIHGSTEGRFTALWAPGRMSREEVEAAGCVWTDPAAALRRCDPAGLTDGMNRLDDGEEVFFVSNPALGLWAWRRRFEDV